jgi:glutaconyl-CoA/methylmalonyl-CoA decarboxylase subunit gamma
MNFTVNVNNQSYQVEIKDINARPVQAVVDGEVFEVTPEAETTTTPKTEIKTKSNGNAPQVVKNAGETNSITAPIPGVITAIKVAVGDSVSPGDEVCSLEAMKMNNAIRTTKAGTIAAIKINQGDHVAHGQVLVELA